MSYDLYVARGNPKHLAGRLEKLKPLDEAFVRRTLRAPPAGVELHAIFRHALERLREA
jgi:hypothetical protein